MIQANELRIGNIVGVWFNNELPCLPTKVCGIDRGVVYFDEGGEEKFRNKKDIENVVPIPLTEEWLIFFWGIDPKDVREQIFIPVLGESGKPLLEVIFTKNRLPSFQIKVSGTKNIFYVHQMQNLFYDLTGNELIMREKQDRYSA